MTTYPWFYKRYKFPKHGLLNHPSLVQSLPKMIKDGRNQALFLSNLCHLLKVNALLDVLPQLLHHSDVDVCFQKSGAHFLQWVQVDITHLKMQKSV